MGFFKDQVTEQMENDRLAKEQSKAVDLGRVWTKESVQKLLEVNDKAVGRALLVLLANQTDDEQMHETTKYDNGRGFSPYDARRMTSMAKFFKRRGFLSPAQLAWLRSGKNHRYHSRIGKYAGQLLKAVNPTAV